MKRFDIPILITPTLTLPEGVKKSAWVFFRSFRRKPESSIFEPLRTAWTPVFTGVTTKRQFFHIFPPQREGNSGVSGWILTNPPPSMVGQEKGRRVFTKGRRQEDE